MTEDRGPKTGDSQNHAGSDFPLVSSLIGTRINPKTNAIAVIATGIPRLPYD